MKFDLSVATDIKTIKDSKGIVVAVIEAMTEKGYICRRYWEGHIGGNNEAELYALFIGALHIFPNKGSSITIYSNSEYARSGLYSLKKWKQNNWIRENGREVANVEMWKVIEEHLEGNIYQAVSLDQSKREQILGGKQ